MENGTPTVSVVLPTYNRADVLHRSIRSVLDQTYEDIELIVVDDGSNDETATVVSDIEDSRLEYIKHETNRGAPAARNTGIAASRSDFIAFQDSDDEWDPRKLEKQMAMFDRVGPEVGVVYTGVWRIHDGEKRYVPQPGGGPREGDLSEALSRSNFISLQTAVVRSRCFAETGNFDERLPRLQDWELWIRIAEQYEFRYVDEPLVTAHVRSDSISASVDRLADAREQIIEKHRERFDTEAFAFQLFRAGHSLLRAGRTRKGRTYLRQAILTDVRVLYCGLFLVSLLGSRVYRTVYRTVRCVRRRSVF